MSSSASSQYNPFLPDDKDNSFKLRRKCNDPNCHEKALTGFTACFAHFDHSHNHSNGASVRSLERTVSPPSRLIFDGKRTVRKTTTRTPFLPGEVRLDQPLSANSRLSNGYSKDKASHSKPTEPSSAETPAKKRPRLISPRDDNVGLNPGRSASPLAMPNGVFQGLQNGNRIDTALPRSRKLPMLNPELRSFSAATTDVDERQRPVMSYDDYLKSPLTTALNFGSDLPKPKTESLSNANRLPEAETNPKILQRNGSLERITSKTSPPAKVTPTTTNPGQTERVSSSPRSKLKAITRVPPLEKQRQSIVQKKEASSLDTFVYTQSCTSQPPPGGGPIKCSELKQQESVLYAPLDPRTHRMRPHSEAWYEQKEVEIRARGGRKANFGKAAQRMKLQRLKDGPQNFEAVLPDRVLQNENWVSALRWFDERSQGGPPNKPTSDSPAKTKRSSKGRKPIAASNSGEKLANGQPQGD